MVAGALEVGLGSGACGAWRRGLGRFLVEHDDRAVQAVVERADVAVNDRSEVCLAVDVVGGCLGDAVGDEVQDPAVGLLHNQDPVDVHVRRLGCPAAVRSEEHVSAGQRDAGVVDGHQPADDAADQVALVDLAQPLICGDDVDVQTIHHVTSP